jgi:hypothetical protein
MARYLITPEDVLPLLIIAGILLFALRRILWNAAKNLMAYGWPSNHGTVEFGSVEEKRARYFTYYIARIDYSYSVGGEYFSGYMEKLFLRESSADRFVATAKGQMVFVRANPLKPQRSALLLRDQPGNWAA